MRTNYVILIWCFYILFICLSIISCEKSENVFPFGTYVKGKVIGYEECGTGTLIQLTYEKLGNAESFMDSVYNNVIKSPGTYPLGTIYFKAREYNKHNDFSLFGTDLCKANFIPYDVPIVVIINSSQIKCND